MANPCLQPNQSDFRGYPWISYSETKTVSFQKDNCPGSQIGSWEDYSKTYTSTISEEDLQQQIVDDEANFNAAGQSNANATGTCTSGCNVTQITPNYIPAAISSTQIWFNAGGYRPGTPQTKSWVDAGNLLARQDVITNWYSECPWITKYAHSSATDFYGVVTLGTDQIFLQRKTTSSGTPCSVVPSRLIYNARASNIITHMCGVASGIIMVVHYSFISTGEKGFDILFVNYDTGMAESLLYVERPSHPDYIASDCMMIYNGTSIWVWLKFGNRKHPYRTRTGIYRIDFSGSSKTITTLLDPTSSLAYSDNGAVPIVGCYTGSSVFFIYGERASGRRIPKTYTISGTPPALPPNSFFQPTDPDNPNVLKMYGLRDDSNGNFYIGYGRSRCARYNSSTNNWTVLRNDPA